MQSHASIFKCAQCRTAPPLHGSCIALRAVRLCTIWNRSATCNRARNAVRFIDSTWLLKLVLGTPAQVDRDFAQIDRANYFVPMASFAAIESHTLRLNTSRCQRSNSLLCSTSAVAVPPSLGVAGRHTLASELLAANSRRSTAYQPSRSRRNSCRQLKIPCMAAYQPYPWNQQDYYK